MAGRGRGCGVQWWVRMGGLWGLFGQGIVEGQVGGPHSGGGKMNERKGNETEGNGVTGSHLLRMYDTAVIKPMICPRGDVALTYPLVSDDCPSPYFSRNRPSSQGDTYIARHVMDTHVEPSFLESHSILDVLGRYVSPRHRHAL